ncbi:MAG: fumarylacetoacetate hydrolase family protein [Candidatus Velthaea sp.]
MATNAERAAIADALWSAWEARTTTAPPSGRIADFTLQDGYAVAAELDARRRQAGDTRAGVKIGFTNTAVWASAGLTDPICGVMYERTIVDAATLVGGAVALASLIAPKIEPEIVLGIGAEGVEWWALGFEIVDCHYPDWRMTPADAVADGGVHALLIVGERHTNELPQFAIELRRDEQLYERGATSAVLGGPLRALDRLIAITSASSDLSAPRAGEIVTTGSLTSAPSIAPAQRWELRSVDGPAASLTIRLV